MSLRRLHNHQQLSWTVRYSAFPGWMVAGRHITDARTIALALIIQEFVGNDRSKACHSYEFRREWGSCRRPSEPLSASIHGGCEAIGELTIRCLWCRRCSPPG